MEKLLDSFEPGQHFYCACDGGKTTNPTHRFYFRLYQKGKDGVARLADQGLGSVVESWEKKFGAVLSNWNPYPDLD